MPLSSATLAPTKWGPDDAGTPDLAAAITTPATSGGDAFTLTGKETLLVLNGSGGSITVTITSQKNNFGSQNTADDITRTVAAGKIARIGPLSRARFADANGLCQVGYSAVTSLSVLLASPATTA